MTEPTNIQVSVFTADDDATVRAALRECLDGTKFRIIGEAADGMDAVCRCRELCPDLVLLDIEMPFLDGLSAAKILRDENISRCVVMLTAFDDSLSVEQASAAGADGYLTKPFSSGQVLSVLDICFQKSKEHHLLEKNVSNLSRRLDSLRIIDRAKLLMMEERGVSENEAYNQIRELSRRKGMSMEDVSGLLIAKLGIAHE